MTAAPEGSGQGAQGTGWIVTVLGGTGFLGRRVVGHLLDRGFRVRATTRHPEQAPSLFGPHMVGAEAVGADVHDEASVAAVLAGADAVVNAVSLYVEHGGYETFRAVHVEAAARIARLAREVGVGCPIHVEWWAPNNLVCTRLLASGERTPRSARTEQVQGNVCTIAVDKFDVLVVGGGPAGSTIAALLAQRGDNVVLVEKDTHPRFHIGESLLPMNLPLFELLGVKEAIDRIGMPKYGVEFVSPWHENTTMLHFAQSGHKNLFYSYEVRRSEFDHILLRNAAAKGACVIEGCRIAQVEFPPDGSVVATGQDGDGRARQFAARFLVDASGRDTLLAGRLAIKQRNRRHASAAVFGHFTGARRLPGKAAGNISIFWFEHGWFWFIPLVDGTTSVGAVCPPEFMKSRGTDVSSFLASLIAQCPALAERLADAQMTGPATATGNYSYRAGRMSGNNFIMLGDAYAFIDPVFSTGVYIAMKSAFLGADVVTAFLHRPGAETDRALRRFETEIRDALARFSWYIYRVNTPAMRDLFMAPRNYFRMQEALLSLLSGDVFDHSPIRSRLLLFRAVFHIKSFFMRQARSLAAWWATRSREA